MKCDSFKYGSEFLLTNVTVIALFIFIGIVEIKMQFAYVVILLTHWVIANLQLKNERDIAKEEEALRTNSTCAYK